MNNNGSVDNNLMYAIIIGAILYFLFQACENRNETYAPYEKPATVVKTKTNVQELDDEESELDELPVRTQPSGYIEEGEQMMLNNQDAASIPLESSKCGAGGAFLSSSLLPKNDESMEDSFTEFSPAILKGQNFLHSSSLPFTQSQSLRNANLQIRSEPANPQEVVCPWMQSTIAPESLRPNLEIGGGCN